MVSEFFSGWFQRQLRQSLCLSRERTAAITQSLLSVARLGGQQGCKHRWVTFQGWYDFGSRAERTSTLVLHNSKLQAASSPPDPTATITCTPTACGAFGQHDTAAMQVHAPTFDPSSTASGLYCFRGHSCWGLHSFGRHILYLSAI